MRTLVIKQDTDLQALSGRLLKANLSADQAKSALASLQALNPHADLADLRAGTMLLVPDAPSFKIADSDPVVGGAFGEFEQLVRAALTQAAADLKDSNAAQAVERADVAAVLKGAVLRCMLEADAELKQQTAEATKALKDDEQAATQAEQGLAATSKAALAKIAELRKRLG